MPPIVAIDASEGCGPRLRGWGRHVRELVAALRAVPDVELRVLHGGGRAPELLWEQVGLPWRLRRERPALVHAPNCFLPLRRPCPGVVTIHDLAFETFPGDFAPCTGAKYRFFAPRAARSAERVICASRFTADDVCERYGVDPARVRVVPQAPALAAGDREPPPGPYLLAVGDLRAKKNLGRLVEAWLELRREGWPQRLVLAGGDAGEGARLRAAAGSEPLELTGYVEDAVLDALMRGAEALVHPSLYEGFGLVVVEAMARGTPVVAADATSLPEAGGDAAAYFDPLDVADLVRVLREVLGEEGRRAELIRRGRARVAGLSWARTAAATAAVYREAIEAA